MFGHARILDGEQTTQLEERLPAHLREFLFFVNPYIIGGEVWPKLPCFAAAFCYYTRSLEGYIVVEQTIRTKNKNDHSGATIAPTILSECFAESDRPAFGDVAMFYRGNRHVHAGLFIAALAKGPVILSKENIGNLPLEDDYEADLLRDYSATRVAYFRSILNNATLEDGFVG